MSATFHISEVDDLFNERKMCKEKIFHLQSISNAKIRVDQSFAVKNCGVPCLTSMFEMRNPKVKILQVKNRFKFAIFETKIEVSLSFIYRFFIRRSI